MRRLCLCLAVLGSLVAGACQAAEPSFCRSVCDSEQRACRVDVEQRAAERGEGLFNMNERNVLASTAAKTQAPSQANQAGERAALQSRRIARSAACDDTYLRCTRACNVAPAGAAGTPARRG
jgi:hypothetical protein